MPKTDLHVHLEGSMRATTVVELADRYGVDLPEGLHEGRYEFRDFRHFIDEWVAGLACLRAPEDFHRVAVELCEDEAAQGVRYAEVSFSLPDHAGRVRDWDGVLVAVLDGLAVGGRDHGIVVRAYVDVVRGIDLELSWQAMRAAVRHREEGVIGIGLGGEERFPPEPYADIFLEAREAGLRSIPHAGETHGPASIRGAIQALGADRIGHGIGILEDPSLVEVVRDRGIGLDVCPTSNVMTRAVAAIEAHPLPRMLEAGLLVTLASDDPSIFGSRVAGEYALVRESFGMGDEVLAEIARNGVRASFAPDAMKADLERGIDGWLAFGR